MGSTACLREARSDHGPDQRGQGEAGRGRPLREARLHERLAATGPPPDGPAARRRPLRATPDREHQLVLHECSPPAIRRSARAAGRELRRRQAGGRTLFAGQLEVGCSFLPPRMAGYEEDLDKRGCPFGDPTRPPDLERARTLVRAADAEGAKVTVWGYDQWPSREVTQAYTEMLNQIGLKAEPKLVGFAVWRQTIGNAKNHPQTGYDGWPQAFPHPLTFFALIESDAIRSDKQQEHLERRRSGYRSVGGEPRASARPRGRNRRLGSTSIATWWRRRTSCPTAIGSVGPSSRSGSTSRTAPCFHQVYLEDWSRFCLKEGGG